MERGNWKKGTGKRRAPIGLSGPSALNNLRKSFEQRWLLSLEVDSRPLELKLGPFH